MSISICYEDMYADKFREDVERTGGELLVNLSSDSWFRGSAEPELHLALSRFRAIEHRKYLVRATTDGVSAVIGPTGEVERRLPREQAAAMVAVVRWMGGRTVFARIGELPAYALSLTAIFFAVVRRRRSRVAAAAAFGG
jgi:apolipoprotein N-acyltransferase